MRMRLRGVVAVAALCAAVSVEPVAQQPEDVQLKAVGGSGGNRFKTRCPRDQHLLGFKLRAGDNIDAVQAICGLAYTPTRAEPAVTAMPQLGGTGGNPHSVTCPAGTPVVIGARVEAEGNDGLVLNAIRLVCGVAGSAQATRYPDDGYDAEFAAPVQAPTGGGIAVSNVVPTSHDTMVCPGGMVAVGVHGRAGKMVDALGLLCGAPVLTKAPLDAPLGGIAPTNAGAVPGPPATIYIARADGMERVIHLGAPDGTRRWERRRKVHMFGSVRRIYPSSAGVMYALDSKGDLRWYKDPDFDREGSVISGGSTVVVKDIARFPSFVIADQGVFYTFDHEVLHWNRHNDYRGGQPGISGPKPMSVQATFSNYKKLFAGGDGVIYGVTQDGHLHWMRHPGYASGDNVPAAMEGALPIGSGWGAYTHVFSAGYGILYGLTPSGELHWYKFPSYLVGRREATRGATLGKRRTVIGPRVVEVGLTGVTHIFAVLPGAADVIR